MNSSCKSVDINFVAEYFKANNNFIILTHSNPDGDTLGSAYALNMMLSLLGKSSVVLCSDNIPEKYGYFTSKAQNIIDPKKAEHIVAVDVADPKLLGSLEHYAPKTELCIDHHVSNIGYSKYLYLDSKAAANCECIFDLARCLNIDLTLPMAEAIYTGISTDSGCFRYSNTTAKTLRTAAELFEIGVDYANINRIMFETKSRARLELETMALESIEFFLDGKCSVMCVTRDMLESTGCEESDIEGLTAMSRCIEGVIAGVTIRQKQDLSYKVSVRSYPPVDAAEVCKLLGGGGHKNAAGCQFGADVPLEQVVQTMVKTIKKFIGE